MSLHRETIYSLLEACTRQKNVAYARNVLAHMAWMGLDSMGALADPLIRLFGSSGSLFEANILFCRVEDPSVFTWHAIMTSHVIHGEYSAALCLYQQMSLYGTDPDQYVFTCALRACASMGDLEHGKLMHDQLIRSFFDAEVVVLNSLVDMYAKCKCLHDAFKVFSHSLEPDLISWSTIIAAYAQHGYADRALELFQTMQEQGIKPDRVSYLSILKACCCVGAVSLGKVMHDQIISSGHQSDVAVGNTLIDMYIKCGSLEEAQKVFEHLPQRDVVSWAAIIAGFSEHGRGFLAIDCFQKMCEAGLEPDRVTFLFLLKACGSVGATRKGRVIHEHVVRSALDMNVVVGSTIIDMYAKCGSFKEAHRALKLLPNRNTVSWNALIGGYSDRGNYKMAMQCLENMLKEGLHPTGSTYTSILTACSHTGYIQDGYMHFEAMTKMHAIAPTTDHLFCIVDLLSRSGRLHEAKEVLSSITGPKKDATGWMSLLTACRKFGNVEVGRECFAKIKHIDPTDGSAYMLMSSIYANAQMWKEYNEIQAMRKCAIAWKKPGQAWIEIGHKVYEFVVCENMTVMMANYSLDPKQCRLRRLMNAEGYVANLDGTIEIR